MENMLLRQMIVQTLDALRNIGFKESSIKNYREKAFNPVLEFYRQNDQQYFSPILMNEFLSSNQMKYKDGYISIGRFRTCRKGIEILNNYHLKGVVEWEVRKAGSKIPLNDYYNEIYTKFVEILDLTVASSNKSIKGMIRQYLNYLENNGHALIHTVKNEDIRKFIIFISPNHQGSMDYVNISLRRFFRFQNNYMCANINLESALFVANTRRRKILPCLLEDELELVFKKIDTKTSKGKRDYAIILTASRTGLRAGDIANLKLTDIDWHNNEIRIIQGKTCVPLILPLNADVGQSIAEYILNARPISSSKYIFLRTFAPHVRFSDGIAIGNVFKKYLNMIGIEHRRGDGKTFHGLRRAIGTQMLKAGVPVTTIAQVLGHKTIDSTRQYISIDTNGLKECALPFIQLDTGGKSI